MILSLKLVGWMLSYNRDPNPAILTQYRRLWVWWRNRPDRLEVENALRQVDLGPPEKSWAKVLAFLDQPHQATYSISELISQLQSLDWQERFIAAHMLVVTGGEAVDELYALATKITSPLHKKAFRLLQAIAQETTHRLARPTQTHLCPLCLTRCGRHSVVVDTMEITFYGCRTCRQSREFFTGEVVAVLNSGSYEAVPQQVADDVWVNWLSRRELFDFDRVEIVQATDEEVERFAVQVGNDTDPGRVVHYEQMVCVVQRSCHLSPNSRRILGRIFGEVRDA